MIPYAVACDPHAAERDGAGGGGRACTRPAPAHGGKFALALHTWQEPYRELLKESAGRPYRMVTPRIGEAVDMENPADFPHWWEGIA